MIYAGENLKFLLKQAELEANEFDKIMKWAKGTASRYQSYEAKAPPMPECVQIISFFKIKLDDFILKNLKLSDNYILSDSPTEGLPRDLTEGERHLYERLLKEKDVVIELLKQQIEKGQ